MTDTGKLVYVLMKKAPVRKKNFDLLVTEDFYCAARIPRLEFEQPVAAGAVARFIYQGSFTHDWARLHHRPMEIGDGFWLNGKVFLIANVLEGQFLLITVPRINIKKVVNG